MHVVLVVDPDQTVLSFLRLSFVQAGFEFTGARRVSDAGLRLRRTRPSIVVLRVALPDGSGLCLLDEVRPAPVILLGMAGQETELAAGLEAGAADVQLFPVDGAQLAARAQAVLGWRTRTADPEVLTAGPVALDVSQRALVRPRASLTPHEFQILRWLLDLPGKALTRKQLLGAAHERAVDSHVASLRRKLGDASSWIETLRGIGYRFRTA